MIVRRSADASLATLSDSSGKYDHANAIVESPAKKAERQGRMTTQMTHGSKTLARKASSRSPRTVAQLHMTSCTLCDDGIPCAPWYPGRCSVGTKTLHFKSNFPRSHSSGESSATALRRCEAQWCRSLPWCSVLRNSTHIETPRRRFVFVAMSRTASF